MKALSYNNKFLTVDGKIIESKEPEGTIEITENGTYDVTDKAEAVVDVQGTVEPVAVTVTSDIAMAPEFLEFLQSVSPSFGQFFYVKKGYPISPTMATYQAMGGIVLNGVAVNSFRQSGNKTFTTVDGNYACSAASGDIFYRYPITRIE